MFSIIVSVSLFGLICASQSQAQKKKYNFLDMDIFDQCEGKDANNYTVVDTYTLDSNCNPLNNGETIAMNLISCSSNGKKTVNSLVNLAFSQYPAGANNEFEFLYLVESGNLQGKYVYFKESEPSESHLKKCSSVLGNSYIWSKSVVMLIADKLDLNIFLNPGGAFELFKRSASTICTGISITF